MIGRVRKSYPNASVYATTLRQVLSANRHMWGAIMLESDTWHTVEPREIAALGRRRLRGRAALRAFKGMGAGEVDTVRLCEWSPGYNVFNGLCAACG